MTNYEPRWRTFIEISADESPLSFEVQPGPRAWPLFENLPPGPYTVRAIHRGFDVPTTVLGEDHVWIEPGRMTWAMMTLGESPADICDGPMPDYLFRDASSTADRDH